MTRHELERDAAIVRNLGRIADAVERIADARPERAGAHAERVRDAIDVFQGEFNARFPLGGTEDQREDTTAAAVAAVVGFLAVADPDQWEAAR